MSEIDIHTGVVYENERWEVVDTPVFGKDQWLALERTYVFNQVRCTDRMCVPLKWLVRGFVHDDED